MFPIRSLTPQEAKVFALAAGFSDICEPERGFINLSAHNICIPSDFIFLRFVAVIINDSPSPHMLRHNYIN
jgi:hypothetical protein